MPTSTYAGLETLMKYLLTVRPKSVLDIGVGFGKVGYLARESLDVMLNESYRPQDWKVKIDGIEAFPDYIQEHHKALYDDIHIGDACEVIDSLGSYDMIVFGDSLEHVDKDKAWELLDKCAERCNRFIVLCIPLGPKWEQGDIYDNEFERHRSFWEKEEIAPFACEANYCQFPGLGEYGRFLIQKDDYITHRLQLKSNELAESGDIQQAISLVENRLSALPPNLSNELLLVDLLVRAENLLEAANRLQSIQNQFPEAHEQVNRFLDKIEQAMTSMV